MIPLFADDDEDLESGVFRASARVGEAKVPMTPDVTLATTPASSSSSSSSSPSDDGKSILDAATGACSPTSAYSCAAQRGIVVGLTAAGGILAGFVTGSFLGGLVGAAAGNLAGRALNRRAPSTAASCLSDAARGTLADRVARKEISATDAETMARSYELAGCTSDAAAIRVAIKAAEAGDLVPRPKPPIFDGSTKMHISPSAASSALLSSAVVDAFGVPEPLASYAKAFMSSHTGGAPPGPRDFYMLQQIADRYPRAAKTIGDYIEAWSPGYLAHAIDDAIDLDALTAYFAPMKPLFPPEGA